MARRNSAWHGPLQTETRSTIPVAALALMRSTARLIAAYAWGPVRADPKGVRSLQRDRHGAGDALAAAPELHWAQQDANALDLVGFRELRQRSEHSVFRIRPRLLADGALPD